VLRALSGLKYIALSESDIAFQCGDLRVFTSVYDLLQKKPGSPYDLLLNNFQLFPANQAAIQ
jgi:hypothetical protein